MGHILGKNGKSSTELTTFGGGEEGGGGVVCVCVCVCVGQAGFRHEEMEQGTHSKRRQDVIQEQGSLIWPG